MRDAFVGYDSWLEAPYQEMCREADAFCDWCDENNLDPDHEQSEIEYSEYLDSLYDDYDPLDDDYNDDDEDWWTSE